MGLFNFCSGGWKAARGTEKSPHLSNGGPRSVSCFSWRVGVKLLLFGKIFVLKLPDLKQVVGAFHQKAAFEVADTLKGPIFSTHVWRKTEKADLLKLHVAQRGHGTRERLGITSCSFCCFHFTWFAIVGRPFSAFITATVGKARTNQSA